MRQVEKETIFNGINCTQRIPIYLLVMFLVLIAACRTEQQKEGKDIMSVDTAAVVGEGNAIIQASFKTLSSNLKQAMSEGGVSNALKFCNIRAMPLTDSLSDHFGVTVKRVSHRPRNPGNRADSLELADIKMYINQLDASGELKPKIHSSMNNIKFHAPIQISSQLCLNCHGTPGTDIAAADLEVLKSLYPEDEATGFSIGELRGLWVVEFPRSYFVNGKGNPK